jgi:hypothetical protein
LRLATNTGRNPLVFEPLLPDHDVEKERSNRDQTFDLTKSSILILNSTKAQVRNRYVWLFPALGNRRVVSKMGDDDIDKATRGAEASRPDVVSEEGGLTSDDDDTTLYKGQLDPVYEAKARLLNKAVRITPLPHSIHGERTTQITPSISPYTRHR